MYHVLALGVCFGLTALLADGTLDLEFFSGEIAYLGLFLGVIGWKIVDSFRSSSHTLRSIRRF